jgi:agmatinase
MTVQARIEPVPLGRPSFLAAPRCTALELLDADLAVIGIPYTTPHDLAGSRQPCSPAPAVLREQSLRLAEQLRHYDYDLGGELLAGRQVRIADCGDAWGLPGPCEENGRVATGVVQEILEWGALPIVLGGDHAATLPALRAYAALTPLCIIHLGAEPDWRDEVDGVRDSRESAMRRAAELPWVTGMLQVGLRGVGAARCRDVDDAVAWGSVQVRAAELRRRGVEAILTRVPAAPRYFISLDVGALDPSTAPGVELPAFGGLDYFETTNLIKGVVARGDVVGMALTGIVPDHDRNQVTGLLGVRLILNLVGALAHAGRRIGVVGVAREGPRPAPLPLPAGADRLPAVARG